MSQLCTKTKNFRAFAFLCLHYSSAIDSLMAEKKWQNYKLEYGKSYKDEEDAERFKIFAKNLEMIEEHNKKYERGETTFTMGLNHMTDWKDEERNRMHGAIPPSAPSAPPSDK